MIQWKKPSELTGGALYEALEQRLRGRVQKAFVFGSHACNAATSDSDIDLVLIRETSASFFQRGLEFVDLFERFGAVDLLVYTPAEWEKKSATFRASGPLVELMIDCAPT